MTDDDVDEVLKQFSELVEKHLASGYLRTSNPHNFFVQQIREGDIFPVKWLLSEVDRSKLTKDELAFIEKLRRMTF